MNFSLIYSKDLSNEEIMEVYWHNCSNRKSKIAIGDGNIIVRLADGTLKGCGSNTHGELGFGDYMDRYSFEEIPNIPKKIAEVACGSYHTIIRLIDGTLMSCGDNRNGQLGLGDTLSRSSFEEIKNIPKNIVEVLCGQRHTMIRSADGIIMCCGSYPCRVFSIADHRYGTVFVKIEMTGKTKKIKKVICSSDQTFVLLEDGTLMVNGSEERFVEMEGIPKNIVEVIACGNNTIIRLTDGTLMGSGLNNYGELGFGDRRRREKFEEIKGIGKNIAAVIGGYGHTIIQLTNGTLMVSGANGFGQLGIGDHGATDNFVEIRGIPKNIAKVIYGHWKTIILLTDGTLMSTGDNMSGELGLGDRQGIRIFEKISSIPPNIAEVISDRNRTMIRLSDGTLFASGSNSGGQIGLGKDCAAVSLFVKIEKFIF
ncbi:MAG: chromosome condensation regulator [Hyperionvirus sp.]|uniref:Chromosome condensation regulator n=1 Tax=Hyperionvirus sp. TaxID=2487770 RepID=A0A3G5A6B5_9VIRU|nr:MAG: chromosome condensation regulator [Hyperionvirus sp.]